MMKHDVRIPVPRTDELRADVNELLPLIAPPGRDPARTMAVLARQPDLLSPFLGWAAALALSGVLPQRDHELLALRVASNCGSGGRTAGPFSRSAKGANGARAGLPTRYRRTTPSDSSGSDSASATRVG